MRNGLFLQRLLRRPYVPGLCPAAVLQSLLQAVFRLGRRHLDDEPDLHVHLHLYAKRRLGRRYVHRQRQQFRRQLVLRLRRLRQRGRDPVRLRLLPLVRQLVVRQCGRDHRHEPEYRLRLQPVLGLKNGAGAKAPAPICDYFTNLSIA